MIAQSEVKSRLWGSCIFIFQIVIISQSISEIAEKLNLPLGTVKSRIFFTRQKLQEELKDFR